MPLSEFDLIDRYFRDCGARRDDVLLGVGDDGAVLGVPNDRQLVAALDTLVDGVHFPRGCAPTSVGHRALAVNLSDLAAMGATPAWALLGLTLPAADEHWLDGFAQGFRALACRHEVALVGGDTTSGPLCITVQVLGFVSRDRAIRRRGARVGDAVFVTGSPGDSTLGLALEMQRRADPGSAAARELRGRFLFPTPRLEWGARLVGLATACIDVSDGLLGDAGKLAKASGVRIELDRESLPISAAAREVAGEYDARYAALTGGEDFELLFTAPAALAAEIETVLCDGVRAHCIGRVLAGEGAIVSSAGSVIDVSHSGFDHFGR